MTTKLIKAGNSGACLPERKMQTFVPDIDYHIQAVFLFTFTYIWGTAFWSDPGYLEDTPTDPAQRYFVISGNVWRGIYSIIVFMVAFSYLEAYPEYGMSKWTQRFNRMHVMISLLYMCFILFMLQQRPDFGRIVMGWLDPSLSKPVGEAMHTYDDKCDFDLKTVWDNFDHYYCVHLGNWFLASFVIRDAYMLHFW